MVARVGGDEFLVLIANARTQDDVAQRARQIVDALSQPIELEDRQASISCSIGIAFYPDNGQHAKLIARADAAMYAAKRAGGARILLLRADRWKQDARERFDLLRDLRLALERNELELYYQPKIDATTGKVTAAEALLRWQHPRRGMVLPGVFIPIAERFGLIRSIGDWVIEDACRQARVWLDHGLHMRVAINLSAAADAPGRHRRRASRARCAPRRRPVAADLRDHRDRWRWKTPRPRRPPSASSARRASHLSIDDFGTGYSSLAYLRKLPAEELKIDRSFVQDVEHSADARAVVDAVVKLAHALGLKVVAEGVENVRQQRILAETGLRRTAGLPVRAGR